MSKVEFKIRYIQSTTSPPRTYVKVRFYRGDKEDIYDPILDKTVKEFVRTELIEEKDYKFYEVMERKDLKKHLKKELKKYKEKGEPVEEQL